MVQKLEETYPGMPLRVSGCRQTNTVAAWSEGREARLIIVTEAQLLYWREKADEPLNACWGKSILSGQ